MNSADFVNTLTQCLMLPTAQTFPFPVIYCNICYTDLDIQGFQGSQIPMKPNNLEIPLMFSQKIFTVLVHLENLK